MDAAYTRTFTVVVRTLKAGLCATVVGIASAFRSRCVPPINLFLRSTLSSK